MKIKSGDYRHTCSITALSGLTTNPSDWIATDSRPKPETDTSLIRSGSLKQVSVMLVKSILHNVWMFGEKTFSLSNFCKSSSSLKLPKTLD